MRIFARALRLVTARCVLLAERQFVQRVGEVRVAVNRNLCARRLARPPGALRTERPGLSTSSSISIMTTQSKRP